MSGDDMINSYFSKPNWVDGDKNGTIKCKYCKYKTNTEDSMMKHAYYHNGNSFILYFECDGLLEGRNAIARDLENDFEWIDMTGGQVAFKDGDFKLFCEKVIKSARAHNVKLYHVTRMHDPGIGLCVFDWWIDGGVKAGVFTNKKIPKQLIAS